MLPIDKNTDETMRSIAAYIEELTGDNYGFMALVFPYGDEERTANYISNCNKEDMIKVLREKADVLEKNLDIKNEYMEQ